MILINDIPTEGLYVKTAKSFLKFYFICADNFCEVDKHKNYLSEDNLDYRRLFV
jgi:hypothetical protein